MLRAVEAMHFVPADHPGELDFRGWLDGRTPPGAPAVVVCAPGGRGPLRLPQVRPAVLSPASARGRRRRGLAPALHAACLVDIDGFTHRQLHHAGLFSTERSARQHARDGRFVGSELGLWPWAVVGGQALPRTWWLDERFALALQRWATEMRVPEVEPAVRRFLPVA